MRRLQREWAEALKAHEQEEKELEKRRARLVKQRASLDKMRAETDVIVAYLERPRGGALRWYKLLKDGELVAHPKRSQVLSLLRLATTGFVRIRDARDGSVRVKLTVLGRATIRLHGI